MEAATVPARAPRGGLWAASPALLRLAPDSQLVALVRAGRPVAFEALYDRHHRAILAFCAHLLGDRHEAEDALQHTFLAAYNGIVTGEKPIHLRPWLYTIARNRCYTLLRARREVAVAEPAHGVSEEPAIVVQRREELRDLVLDLGRLPEDQRAALVMAEIGALSHDEIALALEVPRAKVKALVFQARESLEATRSARETDCDEIRLQLRTMRGPALRRGTLRRHLHDCEGCREYRHQLRGERGGRLAILVPIAPSLALKDAVMRATLGGRAAVAGAGASAGAGTAVKLSLLKPVVGAVMAVMSAASAVVVVHTVSHHRHARPAAALATDRSHAISRHSGGQTTGTAVAARISSATAPAPHSATGHATLAALVTHSAGRGTRLAVKRTHVWGRSHPIDPLRTRPSAPTAATSTPATWGSSGPQFAPTSPRASAPAPASPPAASGQADSGRTASMAAASGGESGPRTSPDPGRSTSADPGRPTSSDPGSRPEASDPGSSPHVEGTSTTDHGDRGTPPAVAGPKTTAEVTKTTTEVVKTTTRVVKVAPTRTQVAKATAPTASLPAPSPTITTTLTRVASTVLSSTQSTTRPIGAAVGAGRYRPGIPRTRRTAQWPLLPGRSPARSLPSPVAPAASAAPLLPH